MVTGITGHLGRLTMERLFVRPRDSLRSLRRTGRLQPGSLPQGMLDHLTGR
jgi:hypothetical protein